MLMAERKAELRRAERKRVHSDSGKNARTEKSLAVQERFLSAFPPVPGGRVALYMAVAGEVGTDKIRDEYLAGGAALFYPRVMENGTLLFYRETGGWVRGKYGLLEPRVTKEMEGFDSGFDLVVVPGVAFDRKGRRLGRGCGYYDRFLSAFGNTAVKVGLAFSRQLLPEVPVDPWDVPMDAIVTEDGFFRVRE
jgi:5-formyltetrahydrofolate cyclo-ligase